MLASVFPWIARIGVTVQPHQVNGQPGAILRDRDGMVLNTMALDILDGQIQAIRAVTNPDKLRHVGPVADASALQREAIQARRPRTDRKARPGLPSAGTSGSAAAGRGGSHCWPPSSRPSRWAAAAASPRLAAPSLDMMFETCTLAVLGEMNSLPAIPALLIPAAISGSTSSSRG